MVSYLNWYYELVLWWCYLISEYLTESLTRENPNKSLNIVNWNKLESLKHVLMGNITLLKLIRWRKVSSIFSCWSLILPLLHILISAVPTQFHKKPLSTLTRTRPVWMHAMIVKIGNGSPWAFLLFSYVYAASLIQLHERPHELSV